MTGAGSLGTAAVLALYVAGTGVLAPAALGRRWAMRSPRLAMSLWLTLPLSWVAAVTLAILAVAPPVALTWTAQQPGHPQPVPGAISTAAASVLAAAVVLRTAWCLVTGLRAVRQDRNRLAALVAAAGHPDRALGAVIVGSDEPAVYCLPGRLHGRGHRIVVSAGALAALEPAQLHAVLAHERSHLRSRHHLALAICSALARAFPRVPLLAQAGPQFARLAEMAADDAAARQHRRDDLAAALVVLATPATRVPALSAGGPAAITRIQRLLSPQPPARASRLAAAAGLALPAAIACLPLLAAACSVASHP